MNSNIPTISKLACDVRKGHSVVSELGLKFGQCHLRLESNSLELIQKLKLYFMPFINNDGVADIQVTALEMSEPDLGLDFIDWKRDAGKVGRKGSYIDIADGRVCRKVRTGMQYLLGKNDSLVFGECLKNDNQVINFLISQYITWLMHKGSALCHASALSKNGEGFAIAAFSGGGKSTLALHLMREGLNFVSNDRTLIEKCKNGVYMNGVPKQPRINPGTILHNPVLTNIIPKARQQELAKITQQELWELEEKYDADVEAIFGTGKFQLHSKLKAFVILNWDRNNSNSTEFKQVDIRERSDLLAAVMKPPGPFFIPPGEIVPHQITGTDSSDYIPILSKMPVYEVTGSVDFDKATAFCIKNIFYKI